MGVPALHSYLVWFPALFAEVEGAWLDWMREMEPWAPPGS